MRAFDVTVTATGYNTFHEAVAFELPALFVPNEHTAVDDQSARASYADQVGAGITWAPRTQDSLDGALRRLAEVDVRRKMVDVMRQRAVTNGAAAAAHLVSELVEQRVGIPA